MITDRRAFLAAAAAGLMAPPRRSIAAAAGPRPWPDLVPDEALSVIPIDVEETRRQRQIVLGNLQNFTSNPAGCIVEIPAGAELPLPWASIGFRGNSGMVPGARIVLRGARGGPKPLLFSPAGEGLLGMTSESWDPLSLELDNLHLRGGEAGATVTVVKVRYLLVRDCTIEGGKFGVFLPSGHSQVHIEDSQIFHGGRGDGATHDVYVNYIEKFTARRSRISAARAEGHALKCYAASVEIDGCTIASWDSIADRDRGFSGKLPPLDLGAWATSRVTNNVIIRRGPSRPYLIEYRNRQWPRAADTTAPDFGTEIVDWRRVDNRDPANPFLFRHLLADNRFINGVMPDGTIDPTVAASPGFAARNNGSGFWASENAVDPGAAKPSGFQPFNERAVVYAVGNRAEGVPFTQLWDEIPYQRDEDRAPILASDRLPAWVR